MNERLLNIQETARYLNVSVNTLYAWVNQRRIPFVKLGRRVLFDLEDLTRWIETQKVTGENIENRSKHLSLLK